MSPLASTTRPRIVLPLVAALVGSLLGAVACEAKKPPRAAPPGKPAASKPAAAKEPRSYAVVGELRSVSEGGKKALIKHEAIPGYMMAMTMEFNVKNPDELKGLTPGDKLRFRLVPTDDTHWIDQIQKIGAAATPVVPPAPVPTNPAGPRSELKPGDVVPDVELLSEEGKRVRLADYRGKALAFTFIFTRCPLPDYCPRMSNYFLTARQQLLADKAAPANWQLLSISFDYEHDSPEILRNYGNNLRAGNPDRWLFALAPKASLDVLAPRLDLMVKKDGDSYQHNLRTVVLDPKGRIHKQLDGNEWTAKDLSSAVAEAAKVK